MPKADLPTDARELRIGPHRYRLGATGHTARSEPTPPGADRPPRYSLKSFYLNAQWERDLCALDEYWTLPVTEHDELRWVWAQREGGAKNFVAVRNRSKGEMQVRSDLVEKLLPRDAARDRVLVLTLIVSLLVYGAAATGLYVLLSPMFASDTTGKVLTGIGSLVVTSFTATLAFVLIYNPIDKKAKARRAEAVRQLTDAVHSLLG